jgi:hypothetical protein
MKGTTLAKYMSWGIKQAQQKQLRKYFDMNFQPYYSCFQIGISGKQANICNLKYGC